MKSSRHPRTKTSDPMSQTTFILTAVNAATGSVALIGSFSNEDDAAAYQGIFDEIDTLHSDSEILEATHYHAIPDTKVMYQLMAVAETIVLDRVLAAANAEESVGRRTIETESGPIDTIHGLVADLERAEELVEELSIQIESHGMTPEVIRNSSEELL